MPGGLLDEARGLVNFIVSESRLDRVVAERAGSLGLPRRAIILALGKASIPMVRGLLGLVEPLGGAVATPHGTGTRISGLEVLEAGHPTPDEGSLRAGEALLEWARSAGEADVVIVLVSGGGSALAEKPLDGLTLDDLKEATRLLLLSGASIHEINTVRKHLSAIKGGRLAAEAYPARVVGLYASDVPGDRLDSIASGPTVADPTTYRDAINVMRLYGIYSKAPPRVVRALERGSQGELPETPKPGDERLSTTSNHLVATNMKLLLSIKSRLAERGYNSLVLTSRLEGESREAGRVVASITLESMERGVPVEPPGALIMGGETTVRVRGKGRGGRNTELALSWALAMRYWGVADEAAILAMDTDGIDGSCSAAGAVMTPIDIDRARSQGLDPSKALDDNDSCGLLEKIGGLVVTGPTGSNLNSVVVVIFEEARRSGAGGGI